MKTPLLPLLFATALPSLGQITADLELSQGEVSLGTLTLQLDHIRAPMATANFIGLATGEFPWVDSSTGVVQYDTPYYNSITFHRVIKGFVSQAGSQNGFGNDGPGYIFPDGAELLNGLSHNSAYVVSMANSGPNSNGSQFFITAAPSLGLDGVHTIFGLVAPGSSRTLADQINCTPVIDLDGPDNILGNGDDNARPITDVVIDSVTINYNGVSFNPSAQGLPKVSAPMLDSLPTPSTTAIDFTQPPRSSLFVSHSGDLTNWSFTTARYLNVNDAPLSTFPLPPAATGNATQFFAPALITYDESALFPSTLANRNISLSIDSLGFDTASFTFFFDASGVTGTWLYTQSPLQVAGAITNSFFFADGYGGQLFVSLNGVPAIFGGIALSEWSINRLGFDSSDANFLFGRYSGTVTNSIGLGFNIRDDFGINR